MARGGGLEQPSLALLAKRLGQHGDWLHVFPEGRISYDGKLADLRWGVGRMVCDVMKHGDGRHASLYLRGLALTHIHAAIAVVHGPSLSNLIGGRRCVQDVTLHM